MDGAAERSGMLWPAKHLQISAGKYDPLTGKRFFERGPHHQYGSQDYMPGEVYFITDGEDIKIGYSGSVHWRKRELQVANAKLLTVIGVAKGTQEDERALHRRFHHIQVRGEWFRATPELFAFIRSVCGSGDDIRSSKWRAIKALRAWAAHKPQDVRDRMSIIECLLWIACRYESEVTRRIVASGLKRLDDEMKTTQT